MSSVKGKHLFCLPAEVEVQQMCTNWPGISQMFMLQTAFGGLMTGSCRQSLGIESSPADC